MNSLIREIFNSRNINNWYQRLPTNFSLSNLYDNQHREKFSRLVILNFKPTFAIPAPQKKQIQNTKKELHPQRVTVKANYISKKKYGASFAVVFRKHLSYITRNGASIVDNEKRKPELFTAINQQFSTENFPNEKNIFKYVISPENAAKLNLKEYTRDVMEIAQKELGHELIWTAAIHNNTEHPHVHVVVRGVDTNGNEIKMPREFQMEGLRKVASREATLELGYRTEKEIEEQKTSEITQVRYTELDKQIKNLALTQAGINTGLVFENLNKYETKKRSTLSIENTDEKKLESLKKLDSQYAHILEAKETINNFDKTNQNVVVHSAYLKARIDFLSRSGLATQVNNQGTYILYASTESLLKKAGRENDIIKNMHYTLSELRLNNVSNGQSANCFLHNKNSNKIKTGQVISKDLNEETNKWNILIKTDKDTYYQFDARSSKQLNTISANSFVTFCGENIGKNRSELIDDIQKNITAKNFSVYNHIKHTDKKNAGNKIVPLSEIEQQLHKVIIEKNNIKVAELESVLNKIKTKQFEEMKSKLHLNNDVHLYGKQCVVGKIIDKGNYQNRNYIIVEQNTKKYLVTEQSGEAYFGFNKSRVKFDFEKVEKNDRIDLTTYSKSVVIEKNTKDKSKGELSR